MGKRILVISDFDSNGSGYMNISTNLCRGLSALGHEVKCAGLNYMGAPHSNPFSIIPASNFEEAIAVVNNLSIIWKPEVLLVAFDIPLQIGVLEQLKGLGIKKEIDFKHIGITAMENGPLVDDWAIPLFELDYVFFISELAKTEAKKSGISHTDHLQIGITSDVWKLLTEEEKKTARKNLGYSDDDFIVITVADNQERKNLLASLKAVKIASESIPNIKHIIVTREKNPYGWKLRTLANSVGITDKVFIYERGMSIEQLNVLYGISDAFLLLSRAEGLGMPILEAMSCGLPCVGTDTGAITELLSDGRGYLVPGEYEIDLDTWGNSKRTFANPAVAAECLVKIFQDTTNSVGKKARKYAESRNWKIPVEHLNSTIEELTNETK